MSTNATQQQLNNWTRYEINKLKEDVYEVKQWIRLFTDYDESTDVVMQTVQVDKDGMRHYQAIDAVIKEELAVAPETF